jgi:hypothetical protein
LVFFGVLQDSRNAHCKSRQVLLIHFVSVELVSMKSLSVNDQSVKGETLQKLIREVNWFQRKEALV